MFKVIANANVSAKRFCECLRELRQFRGWSRDQISNAIGMAPGSVANVENGRGGLSKSNYATLRFIFQASLYDMSEEDAQMFSYVLETLLDPSTDDATYTYLRDKLRAAISGSCVIRANAVHGLFIASTNHTTKYTSDPDGLDWYYDLVGLPIISKTFKPLD